MIGGEGVITLDQEVDLPDFPFHVAVDIDYCGEEPVTYETAYNS